MREISSRLAVFSEADSSEWKPEDQEWLTELLAKAGVADLCSLHGAEAADFPDDVGTDLGLLLFVYDAGMLVHGVLPRRAAGSTPIDEAGLGTRARRCLTRAGLKYIEEAAGWSREELLALKNLGKASLEEIEQKLSDLGLPLKTGTILPEPNFPIALLLPLASLNLPDSLLKRLRSSGVKSIFDLVSKSVRFLRNDAGFAESEIDSIQAVLASHELSLGDSWDGWLAEHLEEIQTAFEPDVKRVRMMEELSADCMPLHSLTLEEEVSALLNPKFNKRKRSIVEARLGWDGSAGRTLEQTGDQFGLTRERVRQILNKAFSEATPSNTLFLETINRFITAAVPALAEDIETEIAESGLVRAPWRVEAISATLDALAAPCTWTIRQRAGVRVIVKENDWEAINRACVAWKVKGGLATSEDVAAAAEAGSKQVAIARRLVLGINEPRTVKHDVSQDPPAKNSASESLPNWLVNRVQQESQRRSEPWSLIELGFSEDELEEIRAWTSTDIEPGVVDEPLALMFLCSAAMIAQQLAEYGTVWPYIRRSFSDAHKRLFFDRAANPSNELKEELARVCSRYKIRNAFGRNSEHHWVRTIFLQFGLSLQSLSRLPAFLERAVRLPVALEELTSSCSGFGEVWQVLQLLRRGELEEKEARKRLAGSPWLSGLAVDGVIRSALEELEPNGPEAKSEALFGTPRLDWTGPDPVFELPVLEDSAALTEEVYSIVIEKRRFLLEKGPVGYELQRPIRLSPDAPTVIVDLEHNRKSCLAEPIRIKLTPDPLPFAFYSLTTKNSVNVSDSVVAGRRMALLLPSDWALNTVADEQRSVLGGWQLLSFRRGVPHDLVIRDQADVVVWTSVQDGEQISPPSASTSVVVRGPGGQWGRQTKLTIEGVSPEFAVMHILIGPERIKCTPNPDGSYSATATISPDLHGQRVELECVRRGRLCWIRSKVSLKDSFGAAIEKSDGWLVLTPEIDLDAEYLARHPVKAETPPVDETNRGRSDWAWLEGFEKRCQLQGGQQKIENPDGIGSGLWLVLGPFNHSPRDTFFRMARAVIDSGQVGHFEEAIDGFKVYLRHTIDFRDGHEVWIWREYEDRPVLVEAERIRPFGDRLDVIIEPRGLLGAAFSFKGIWQGACTSSRGWAGFAELCDNTPDWIATSQWFTWWRLPILHPMLHDAVATAVRRAPVETFLGWLDPRIEGASVEKRSHLERWSSALTDFFEEIHPSPTEASDLLLRCWQTPVVQDACGASPLFMAKVFASQEQSRRERYLNKLLDDQSLDRLLERAQRALGRDVDFVRKSLLPDFKHLLRGEKPARPMNLRVATASSPEVGRYLVAAILHEWNKNGGSIEQYTEASVGRIGSSG